MSIDFSHSKKITYCETWLTKNKRDQTSKINGIFNDGKTEHSKQNFGYLICTEI